MDKLIIADLYRYRPNDYSFKELLLGFRSQGFRFSFFLRKVQGTNSAFLSLFYRVFLRRYMYKYGFQISAKTNIGEGLYIGHFGTIIISVNAKIGKNCNLSPGITIGRDHRGIRKGAPTIGDKVWIGTNSVIVGNILIGSNVLIAPNTFVNFNVPSDSIVIGNPAKIIQRSDATDGYINNIFNE